MMAGGWCRYGAVVVLLAMMVSDVLAAIVVSRDDIYCLHRLRFTNPVPGSVVRTKRLTFEIEGVSKVGSRVKALPVGTLCYKDSSVSWEKAKCMHQGSPVTTWSISPREEIGFFRNGQMSLDAAFFTDYQFQPPGCRERIKADFDDGPTGKGEVTGSTTFSYQLGGRYDGAPEGFGVDPSVTMDMTLSDRPDVAGALSLMACAVTNCNDHHEFIRQLMMLREKHHPAIVDPSHFDRTVIPVIKTRNEIGEMLFNDGGMRIGVEVGVQRGVNLEYLMSHWQNAWVVFGVDPWIQQVHYEDIANLNATGQNENLLLTMDEVARFGAKARLIRDTSVNAAPLFPDESLDFVYLDARHDYKAVTEDLLAFWPKIRKGGIFAGHDFLDAEDVNRNLEGMDWSVLSDGTVQKEGKAVKGAVLDFAAAVNRQVVVAYDDGEWPSWLIRK